MSTTKLYTLVVNAVELIGVSFETVTVNLITVNLVTVFTCHAEPLKLLTPACLRLTQRPAYNVNNEHELHRYL
jgi:hypothetical protein